MELDEVYGSQTEEEAIKTSVNSMTNDLTFVAQENVVSLYEDGDNHM